MDKTISSSSFDVIVIRQPNGSYKSTPFQVAFSSNLLKNITKKNQVQLIVNDQKVDIPLRLDIKTGRMAFIKKYQKRNILSDSSDFSDDDISQTSQSRDKILHKNISLSTDKKQKTEQYKNQKAPKPFWQFAWLFKTKSQQAQNLNPIINSPLKPKTIPLQQPELQSLQVEQSTTASTLQKIDQQLYQGQQTSKQPMFHISLCKSALKKKQKREDILAEFYKRRIPYQEFIKDPTKFLSDSELIVKIDDSLYTWELGIAILTCRLAYGKELSPLLIDDMIRNKFTKSKFITYFTGDNLTKIDISNLNNKKQYTIQNAGQKGQQFPTRIVVKYRKNPDTETIYKMKLKNGLNKAKFILNTGATKQEINMKIFLWDYNEKLIVSDIDGTITKSDIAGQLWTNYIHTGVTKLFTQAYKRGYKIVYLTARAIGQYNQTTKFLQSAQQDGVKLPQGPLLMSPDGFLKSFTREVIDKTPDFLKTKILATLNEIFPHGRKPLYCGFGNRETDSVAYIKTNIDTDRIFFITPKSIITKESKPNFTTSYVQMLEKIEEYFPLFTKQLMKEQDRASNDGDDLRRSKNSADMDEQFLSGSKRKKSLSESSETIGKDLEENNDLKMSQRIKRSSPDDDNNENQYVQNYSATMKHGRSKSVEHNNQYMCDKMQDLQALLKASLSGKGVSEQDTKSKPVVVQVKSPTKLSKKQLQQKIQSFNQPLPKQDEYKATEPNKILNMDLSSKKQENNTSQSSSSIKNTNIQQFKQEAQFKNESQSSSSNEKIKTE